MQTHPYEKIYPKKRTWPGFSKKSRKILYGSVLALMVVITLIFLWPHLTPKPRVLIVTGKEMQGVTYFPTNSHWSLQCRGPIQVDLYDSDLYQTKQYFIGHISNCAVPYEITKPYRIVLAQE